MANLDKHGLDFAALDLGFFLSAVVQPSHSRRLLALGTHDGRRIAVLFRPLGQEAISIVSMRPARSDERRVIP